MRHTYFVKSTVGGLALAVASMFAAPNAAQAQLMIPCDTGTFLYYGCEEAAGGIAGTGAQLQSIGEGFVQQQLSTTAGGFATPTGRLRHTSHDGLRDKNFGFRTLAYDIDEGSVLGNVHFDLPGTYFGGKVRINGIVGYGWMTQDSVPFAPGVVGHKTDIDSVFYGGSYMWSQGNFYTMSMIIGVSGEADGRGVGGLDYSYDLSGYFTNSVVGYTFQLPDTWRFDLRGALGHYDVSTDRFVAPDQQVIAAPLIKGVAEAWSLSLTGTLFTMLEVDGGGVLRPYILGSYKRVVDEDIEIKGDFVAEYEQAKDYGRVELGMDYVQGNLTYGASTYTEFSADESTIGARLGVSVKLQ
ncbi:MAG TPA: autotransporter outer membrane beta-barrel domain-containing protein [Hyphomicrobium sp.]|nr:autotransporter outer membrane beta-barrel domain-containing protein [Hyphomicrobium sp.]HRO50514.1 autotransporter outer membrane beta-barrel domain-containing protein [Hyphomicrobium sp.]